MHWGGGGEHWGGGSVRWGGGGVNGGGGGVNGGGGDVHGGGGDVHEAIRGVQGGGNVLYTCLWLFLAFIGTFSVLPDNVVLRF